MTPSRTTRLAGLALAIGFAGCDGPCLTGTLFLTAKLDPTITTADHLDIRIMVGGKLEEFVWPHAPGAAIETFQVDFKNGYPAGMTSTVTVSALAGGASIGTGTSTLTLPGGCATLTVTLTATAASAHNLVFVTSTGVTPTQLVAMGNGSALTGADRLCSDSATNAGLPGSYVAWLSDGTTDAKSRLNRARGWWRTDGLPFADSLATLLIQGQVFYPARKNELGLNSWTETVLTATSQMGTDASDCAHFGVTSSASMATFGSNAAGTALWTQANVDVCSNTVPIYCFGTDYAAPVTFTPAVGRKAFVSGVWPPSGGLAAADAWCNQHAQANGVAGNFLALLASDSASALSRFDLNRPTWVRLDGVRVAATVFDFSQQNLLAPINVAADGKTYVTDHAWAGATDLKSTGLALDCRNWTSSSGNDNGAYAETARSQPFATSRMVPCWTPQRLICLEN